MKTIALAVALIAAVYASSPPQACASCLSGLPCYGAIECGPGCSCILINGPGQQGVCS